MAKKRIILELIQEGLYISDKFNRLPFSTKKDFLKWAGNAWLFRINDPSKKEYIFHCFSDDAVGIYSQESDKL